MVKFSAKGNENIRHFCKTEIQAFQMSKIMYATLAPNAKFSALIFAFVSNQFMQLGFHLLHVKKNIKSLYFLR